MRAPGPPDRRRPPRRVGDPGQVEVFVADEQSEVEVDVARYRALCELVLDAEGRIRHKNVRGDALDAAIHGLIAEAKSAGEEAGGQ